MTYLLWPDHGNKRGTVLVDKMQGLRVAGHHPTVLDNQVNVFGAGYVECLMGSVMHL